MLPGKILVIAFKNPEQTKEQSPQAAIIQEQREY